MRTRLLLQIMQSTSANEEKDISNHKSEIHSDVFTDSMVFHKILPISTTDLQITPASLDQIKFLAVKTTSNDPTQLPVDIGLKLNSTGATAITISPMGPTASSLNKEGWLVLTGTSITDVYLTNPSGTVPMKVTLFMSAV